MRNHINIRHENNNFIVLRNGYEVILHEQFFFDELFEGTELTTINLNILNLAAGDAILLHELDEAQEQFVISVKKKPRVFCIADTHFSHANIIKYCDRPFNSVEEMNETLIENWNEVVSPSDIVMLLGDVCLGKTPEYERLLPRLNGRIIMIFGNHDRKTPAFYERFFDIVSIYPLIFICGDVEILFSHAPKELNYCMFNIHGHIHEHLSPSSQHFCVSVEQTNYYPMLLEKIVGEEICEKITEDLLDILRNP